MHIVIFRARVRRVDAEYTATAARMRELALGRFGCLAFHSVTEGRDEIAVSYWPDEDAILAWREHPEHVRAQQRGRERWYESWSVDVAEVGRSYAAGERDAPRLREDRPTRRADRASPALRDAVDGDVPAMLAIYAPVVEHTAISFELEPPGADELARRFREYAASWAWLVAEEDGIVTGYAYGSRHRARAAYDRSVETSVFVAERARGRGVGAALYGALLPRLAARGYAHAYAGITQPNPASVALHRAAGFAAIGVFPSVGFKFGAWHDVEWFHRRL